MDMRDVILSIIAAQKAVEQAQRADPPVPPPPVAGGAPFTMPFPAPSQPTASTGQRIQEEPLSGYGAVMGAMSAGIPGPAQPRGPVFNSLASLDPTQIEDRRGASTLLYHPPARPVPPPFYQPWLLPEYRQQLAEWQQQMRDWQMRR